MLLQILKMLGLVILQNASFTYQVKSRDTLGFAAKGAWFEVEEDKIALDGHTIIGREKVSYNIYKDPVTDDGTKKSLKGLLKVDYDYKEEIAVQTECTSEEENEGLLQVIYEDGKFYNQTTLTEIRKRLSENE